MALQIRHLRNNVTVNLENPDIPRTVGHYKPELGDPCTAGGSFETLGVRMMNTVNLSSQIQMGPILQAGT